MKLKITKHSLRIFEREGRLLARTGQSLAVGTEVELGESVDMCYDHRDQQAAEIVSGDHRGKWIIVSEIEKLPWHLALGGQD